MKYYNYIQQSDTTFAYRVYLAIAKCKKLAIAKYKSNWEDALDTAYFHVLDNFDDSKGDLDNYAMSIVSTIYLNKFSKEVTSDLVISIESDKSALEDSKTTNPYDYLFLEEEDIEYSTELENCIQYLLPYFIKDYELFYSKDASTRKLKYKGLFERFTPKVIMEAVNKLTEGYYDEVKYLNTLSKSCHARDYDTNRYKNSLDKTVSYVGRIGDIVKCKYVSKKRRKCIYLLDIEDILSRVYTMFYDEDGIARRVIYEEVVYCTLSGKLVCSKQELYEVLEREIIGKLLALRTNLKVLHYVRGAELLVTSTQDSEPSIILNMFKAGIYLPFKRLIMGED